jgi:hypothetical protein
MLTRAHVADRPRLLAVAGETGGRQGVERRTLGTAREQFLAQPRPAEESLEGPDVKILPGVRARQHRELGRRDVVGADPASLDERDQPERLDGRAERDEQVRVTEAPDDAPVDRRLDHVAAVDALLDAVADDAHEDRAGWARAGRCPPARRSPRDPTRRARRPGEVRLVEDGHLETIPEGRRD